MQNDNAKILDLAYEAGAILLGNGAEISRVEDTIQRIATYYGVDDIDVFVLSNIRSDAGLGSARYIVRHSAHVCTITSSILRYSISGTDLISTIYSKKISCHGVSHKRNISFSFRSRNLLDKLLYGFQRFIYRLVSSR